METPTIASSAYASTVFNLANATSISGLPFGGFRDSGLSWSVDDEDIEQSSAYRVAAGSIRIKPTQKELLIMPTAPRRLVQVFIADPHEDVPLSQALLYEGKQQLTDATDQELFFEIDIKGILDAYNVERIKLVDKSVKERTQLLEPARVRDLKMTVVNIATF